MIEEDFQELVSLVESRTPGACVNLGAPNTVDEIRHAESILGVTFTNGTSQQLVSFALRGEGRTPLDFMAFC